jgi:NADH:ubiquinone reductase (non-electrogenic)
VLLLQEHYPNLMKDVKIRIIELMDHVLSTYDRKISEYTAKRFNRAGQVQGLFMCLHCQASPWHSGWQGRG